MLSKRNNNSVYRLRDPRDFMIRYIGITDDIKARYSAHLHTTKDRWNPGKVRWIRELRDEGLEPILEVDSSGLTRAQSIDREMTAIYELLEWNVPLLNVDMRRPFSHWTLDNSVSAIVGYKVVPLETGGYWVVGVTDYKKMLYRLLDDHKVYRADYHAYPKCKKLNEMLAASK